MLLRSIDSFNARFGDLIAWVYFVVFAITLFDVAARYVFNSPTSWGADLVIAICAMHYALSGAMALQRGDHVRIDLVYNLFPGWIRRLCDVVAGLVIIALMLALIWFGWQQAAPAIRVWETTGTSWNAPTPVFMKLAIPVAGVLMLLQAVVNLVRDVRALRAGEAITDTPSRS